MAKMITTGPILTPLTVPPSGDPFPHSMDPQLRGLGLSSVLTPRNTLIERSPQHLSIWRGFLQRAVPFAETAWECK